MRMPFIAIALLTATPSALLAQSIDSRVDRLEKEMQAVQRKVFPGGSSKYFTPEISSDTSTAPVAGVPATTPIEDLTARVNALEEEMRRLTGQSEENAFKLRQMEEALTRMKGDFAYRLNVLEGNPTTPPANSASGSLSKPTPSAPSATAPTQPAPALAASQDASADAAEEAYLAGYRLWRDGHYAEARAALESFLITYPKHSRVSFARNLIGRAWLDEGKPAQAIPIFYDNVKSLPRGERAPDSLYYLAQALTRYKKPADACLTYNKLTEAYPEVASGRLKDSIAKGRAEASCKPS